MTDPFVKIYEAIPYNSILMINVNNRTRTDGQGDYRAHSERLCKSHNIRKWNGIIILSLCLIPTKFTLYTLYVWAV